MCSPATCRTCGKATYTGCGRHVEQVLGGVAQNKRCACGSAAKAEGSGRSLLAKIFGR
jgi:hypothetical protein